MNTGIAAARTTWLLAAGLSLAAFAIAGWLAGDALTATADAVRNLGAWAPVGFAAAYALLTLLLVPAWPLSLLAGALFGVVAGTATVFVGSSAGAIAAFLLARGVAREAVTRRLSQNLRLEAIDRAVAKEGARIVVLLRLSPAFPFTALNYALGLTRIGLRDYSLACFAMLPGTLLYVYTGKLGGDVAGLAGGATSERSPTYWVLIALGLAATVAVTARVARISRDALRTLEASGEAPGAAAPDGEAP